MRSLTLILKHRQNVRVMIRCMRGRGRVFKKARRTEGIVPFVMNGGVGRILRRTK